jgi:DNA-binding NarL/FixJ family response regulator
MDSCDMSVRIALADDQALVRKGLRALLSSIGGIDIVIEADSGRTLIDALATQPVDVVVSDIRMPELSGIDALIALRERGDKTPLILLTTFDDHELMLAAVDAGAQGFLLKDASPEDLRDAILRVASGETLLQPVSIDPVRSRLRYVEPRSASSDARFKVELSERELAILRLMAGGYSNKEIARTVFLAEGTVKNYVSEILEKLDTRDRTRAVLKAITLRLL